MYVCMYVSIYTYIHIHICMYVCMYVCVYVCMYIACRGAAALLERRQAAGSQGELPSLFCPLPPCLLDFPPARRPASPRRLCVYLLASKLLLPPAIRHGRSSTGWWKPFPAPRPLRNRRARLMSNPARLPIAVKDGAQTCAPPPHPPQSRLRRRVTVCFFGLCNRQPTLVQQGPSRDSRY